MDGLRVSISADGQPLLVVARRLVVGVDGNVRTESLSTPDFSPGVDRVNISELIGVVQAIGEHSGGAGLQGNKLADIFEPATTATTQLIEFL